MRKNSASAWTRKYQFDTAEPTQATPKRKATTASRKRTARRYTVSDQQARYAQTQGTPTRGPIAKAMHTYTDAHGQVWAKWNADDEWEYCGREAYAYR